MAQARAGDKVRVHYDLLLGDETDFESSGAKEPLEFILGRGMVITGLESAVIGMREGQTKKVSIPPEEAFGHRREELVFDVERTGMPADLDLELGKVLRIRSNEGRHFDVTIVHVDDKTIRLDGNHPLSGKTLEFEIELIKILEQIEGNE